MPGATESKTIPEAQKSGSYSPFKSFQDEMERMFHAFSLPEMNWRSGMLRETGSLGLRIDVGETDTEIHVTADLPGVEEDDIEISLDDDLLHISAERSEDSEKEEETWHVVERSFGRVQRTIRVPKGIDPDAIEASFKNGVLSIALPKPPGSTSNPKKITVRPG